jgi:tRNA1Val (adenine37-N6)-methyltransferase
MSFQFKQFLIQQDRCAQKVSEVACIQGAWTMVPPACTRVLDIGSGTALLSLMLAQRYEVQIDAIEIDFDTYTQGKENIQNSPFKEKINALHGDLNTFLFSQSYDFIISNPPFFEKQLKAEGEKENAAKHSSQLTLKDLIGKIETLLTDQGQFSILFPFNRMEELEKVCAAFQFYPISYLTIQHSVVHLPKVFAAIFSKQRHPLQQEIFIIKENGVHTERMRRLTEAYYL